MALGRRTRSAAVLVGMFAAMSISVGGVASAADPTDPLTDPVTGLMEGAEDAVPGVGALAEPGEDDEEGENPGTGTPSIAEQCRAAVGGVTGALQADLDAALALCEGADSLEDIPGIVGGIPIPTPPGGGDMGGDMGGGGGGTDSGSTDGGGFGAQTESAPPTTGFLPTGDDLNCSDFASQADAQAVLAADASDPNNLDADLDGQACDAGASTVPTTDDGFPTGGVAAGDGPLGLDLGQIALLGMGGVVALGGAARLGLTVAARRVV